MSDKKLVRITSPSIDEKDGMIIIRGALDYESIIHIQTPEYQREVVKNKIYWQLTNIFLGQGLNNPSNTDQIRSQIPDVTLACRNFDDFVTEENSVTIPGEYVYIVDGLQRISAAMEAHKAYLENNTDPFNINLGCVIYLNTTQEFERSMFKNTNTNRTSVAADVLLRGSRFSSPAAKAIWDWSNSENSCQIAKMVCWQQSINKSHLIRANSIFRTVNTLMARFAGNGGVTQVSEILRNADLQLEAVGGSAIYKQNIQNFYEALTAAFRLIDPAERVPNSLHLLPHLAFADLVAKHDDFWEGNGKILKIPQGVVNKIGTFSFTDEQIRLIIGSTKTTSVKWMRMLMVEHLNKGKTYKLHATA